MRSRVFPVGFVGLLLLAGCDNSAPAKSTQAGGTTSSGGQLSGGSGGATVGSGGVSSSGGASAGGDTTTSGGVSASGGTAERGGTTVSGGSSGRGGTTSSGGATASGGAIGSGGTTSSGGATGSGGSTGRGGATGSGGSSGGGSTTASGGATIVGGATGSGGATGAGGSSAAGKSPGCGKTPTLAKSVPPPNTKMNYIKITSAGLNRQYLLWYPDNYDENKPYRLILNYHWMSGSASQVFDCKTEGISCYTTQTPFFGLLSLAENSTIFVTPDGIDAGWANTDGRDTTLTDDILKQVEADLCIDTTRVFAQGFSYGGAMSATLGCQRADVFRAVVVFAGGISGMSGACTGTSPIAYYGATGTQDSGYSGGQKAVQHFAEVNGCTAQTLPTPPTGGHTCISFAGCSAGHPVRWCPFDDIHTPSPKDKGASTTWQPKEVWTFLTQF